jgi:putative inorganic carbon (hco3(-)) transporter
MFDTSERIKKLLPCSIRSQSDLLIFLALAGGVSLVVVSIAASQILLAIALGGILWTWKRREGFGWQGEKKLILPLLLFSAWTIVAVFASSNVALNLKITKKFFLFLLVPMVPLVMRGKDRLNWTYKAIFLIAAVSSLTGLAQFAANPNRDLLHRISGFMSQWMTFSGLLMLALVLLTAYGLTAGIRRHKWVIPVGILLILALILSQTRNAWMGAFAGIAVLLLLRRPRAIFILIAAILIFYLLSTGVMRDRFISMVDMTDPRFHVYLTAMHTIQDNPMFGVGPKSVEHEAPKYRNEQDFPDWLKRIVALYSSPEQYREEEKEFPVWLYQHMLNNFFQIAAERGIPGLILWIWLMGRFAWDAWGCYRNAKSRLFSTDEDFRKEALMASSGALACWTALMVAGMFEYNFGDSEVLTLFLFAVSAPYAFADARMKLQKTDDESGAA